MNDLIALTNIYFYIFTTHNLLKYIPKNTFPIVEFDSKKAKFDL